MYYALSLSLSLALCDLKQRATAANMQAFKDAEDSLNAQYGSNIVTEFPFNGLGILEKVMRLTRRFFYFFMRRSRQDSRGKL